MKNPTTKATKRTAVQAVAEHNVANGAMLQLIAEYLPSCGPEANWGHAGTAGHVRAKLREILAGLAMGRNEDEDAAQARLEAEAIAAFADR